MMNVITTCEKKALTPTNAAALVATPGIHILGITTVGVEIVDTRPLMDRLAAPIKGKGVVRYFGDTQKVITKAYARKLGLLA